MSPPRAPPLTRHPVSRIRPRATASVAEYWRVRPHLGPVVIVSVVGHRADDIARSGSAEVGDGGERDIGTTIAYAFEPARRMATPILVPVAEVGGQVVVAVLSIGSSGSAPGSRPRPADKGRFRAGTTTPRGGPSYRLQAVARAVRQERPSRHPIASRNRLGPGCAGRQSAAPGPCVRPLAGPPPCARKLQAAHDRMRTGPYLVRGVVNTPQLEVG